MKVRLERALQCGLFLIERKHVIRAHGCKRAERLRMPPCGDHLRGPEMSGDLHSQPSRRTCRAVDQHGLAASEVRAFGERCPRRHAGNRHRRSQDGIERLGDFDALALRDDGSLGQAA
jgi:hypothetical protein